MPWGAEGKKGPDICLERGFQTLTCLSLLNPLWWCGSAIPLLILQLRSLEGKEVTDGLTGGGGV